MKPSGTAAELLAQLRPGVAVLVDDDVRYGAERLRGRRGEVVASVTFPPASDNAGVTQVCVFLADVTAEAGHAGVALWLAPEQLLLAEAPRG